MEVIQKSDSWQLKEDTAVSIGKFDGVHIGHRKILQELMEYKKRGLRTCVFTFDPTPAVFFGQSDGRELTTREEKRLLFEEMGVDILVEFPLTKESAAMPPEKFAREILCEKMRAKVIVAGSDLSFGAGGRGNADLLRSLSKELDFSVVTVDKVKVDGQEVSSTRIRQALENGNMEEVERMLGMPYTIRGEVLRGNQIGRTIGFPTVNLIPPQGKLVPPFGVYFSKVSWKEKEYRAITNIGYKPTVSDEKVCGVESFLYDFDENLYGEKIEVALLGFRRPERRFAGLEDLRRQLKEDIQVGREKI